MFSLCSDWSHVFWEEYHRGDEPFSLHHIKRYTVSPGDANIHYLVKVVLARFLHWEATIFLFPYLFFGSKPHSLAQPGVVRSGIILSSISWSRVYLHIRVLFGILAKEDLSPPLIYLFNYFVISVWTHIYLLCTLCYRPILHYLFCWSNCSNFGHWELFQMGSYVPLT